MSNATDEIWGPLITSLTGTASPSIKVADRVWTPDQPVPFNCTYLVTDNSIAICPITLQTTNNTVGQNNRGGGLISRFSNNTSITQLNEWAPNPLVPITWGKAMLVINATSVFYRQFQNISEAYIGEPPNWESLLSVFTNYGYIMQSDATLLNSSSGIWSKFVTREGAANLSVSLCYAAWDTARLQIDASSDVPRQEPVAHWSPDSGYKTIPDVNIQLGNIETAAKSIESRGILKMAKKDSFIPTPEDAVPITILPAVQQLSMLGFTWPEWWGKTLEGNNSAVWPVNSNQLDQGQAAISVNLARGNASIAVPALLPDPAISQLFDSFMESSGSLARSMSSLITILSGMVSTTL